MIHSRRLCLLVRCCSRYGVSASLDFHLVGRHVRVLAESRPMAARPKAGRRRADSVDWLRVPLITAHRGVGSGITSTWSRSATRASLRFNFSQGNQGVSRLDDQCYSPPTLLGQRASPFIYSAAEPRKGIVRYPETLATSARSFLGCSHSRRRGPSLCAVRAQIRPQRRLSLSSPSLLLTSTVRLSFCCFPGL